MNAPASQVIPCFGIKCEQHAECRCYEAVEFSDAPLRIGFCPQDEAGQRTRFIPINPITTA